MVLEVRTTPTTLLLRRATNFWSTIEAVEALGFLTAENAPQWQRAGLADENTCDEDFDHLWRASERASAEIEEIAMKERDEPPKPNAFAITVFCVKDAYESRGDDILSGVRGPPERTTPCSWCPTTPATEA